MQASVRLCVAVQLWEGQFSRLVSRARPQGVPSGCGLLLKREQSQVWAAEATLRLPGPAVRLAPEPRALPAPACRGRLLPTNS